MEWIERDETKDRNKVIIIDVGIKVDERERGRRIRRLDAVDVKEDRGTKR